MESESSRLLVGSRLGFLFGLGGGLGFAAGLEGLGAVFVHVEDALAGAALGEAVAFDQDQSAVHGEAHHADGAVELATLHVDDFDDAHRVFAAGVQEALEVSHCVLRNVGCKGVALGLEFAHAGCDFGVSGVAICRGDAFEFLAFRLLVVEGCDLLFDFLCFVHQLEGAGFVFVAFKFEGVDLGEESLVFLVGLCVVHLFFDGREFGVEALHFALVVCCLSLEAFEIGLCFGPLGLQTCEFLVLIRKESLCTREAGLKAPQLFFHFKNFSQLRGQVHAALQPTPQPSNKHIRNQSALSAVGHTGSVIHFSMVAVNVPVEIWWLWVDWGR